jgi:hypothetical protein
MARATAQQVKIRFEKRFKSEILVKCEIPEVRKSLDTIRRGTWKRWKAGEPVELPTPPKGPRWGFAEPFWQEVGICRSNGVEVRMKDCGEKPPTVFLSLTLEAEQEGLTARFQYPGRPLLPGEYDLWEIKRDAPLSRILEDVEYQWRERHDERRRLQLLDTRGSCQEKNTDRLLWSIEAYRRRYHGETFREIAIAMDKGQSTVRRAITDLCARTGLPKPRIGTALPDAPDSDDCDNCAKRHSPSQPCKDCPWTAYIGRHFGPSDLPGFEREFE